MSYVAGRDRPPSATRRAVPRRRPRASTVAPFVFLLPAAVLFVVFMVVPIVYAVMLSTRGTRIKGGAFGRRVEQFVGLDNYRSALSDPALWAGLRRLLIYGGLVVPIMLGLALLFALLLDVPRVRLARFSRVAIFLPYAVPGVIATLLWGFLYLPDVSPIHYVAALAGLPAPDFFGKRSIFGAVANIAIWGGIGFNMVVIYTSLRALPSELFDAARVDGCSELMLALRIKVPLLVPSLVLTGVFSLIATLQVFSEPMTLRPLSNALDSAWVPLMKVYRDAFVNDDQPSAAATSVLLAAVTLVISLLLLRVLQRRAFGDD